MKRIALLAGLLIPAAVAAQEPPLPPAAGASQPGNSGQPGSLGQADAPLPETRLPLDAMRHRQPTLDDLRLREGLYDEDHGGPHAQPGGAPAGGSRTDGARTDNRHDVDDLYKEVMRRSAPGPETGGDAGAGAAPGARGTPSPQH